MLEFKNVSLMVPGGDRSAPCSMMLSAGETACLCGAPHTGKSRLLRAVMGLEPIASGYISIDGEPITPASAAYFRRKMAYVPQELPAGRMKVSELCHTLFNLRINRGAKLGKEMLMAEWQWLGIDEVTYALPVDALPHHTLRLMLLSLLPLLNRPIVLADDIPQTEHTAHLLQRLAAGGAEVVYTCENNMMACDKLIKL